MRRYQSRIRTFALLCGVIAVTGVTLVALFIRDEAGGLSNALSRTYWEERAKGFDEFQPEFAWFRRGPRDRKEVCLTIDDGPHGWCTQTILKVLREENVRATFFVVGKRMAEHPALVKQMIAEGHEVGNHTYTHPRLNQIPLGSSRKEIEKCGDGFQRITGRRMTLFRPPGMKDNRSVLRLAKSMGYLTVDWNVGAHDFMLSKNDPKVTPEMIEHLKATPDQIADRVVSNVKNGSIILLHDQMATAEALPKIIRTLRAQGYHFVTCAEALEAIDHPLEIAANPRLQAEPHLAQKAAHAVQPVLSGIATVPAQTR